MRPIHLILLLVLAIPILMAGCSEDSGSPTGPPVNAKASHYEISVQMSSIWAENNCENAPGNIGEFRYTLLVRTPDEFGDLKVAGSAGVEHMLLDDGDRTSATTAPIRFLVPNDPGSSFEVEYLIGEYDPDPDFQIFDWATHIFDRGGDQLWAAETSYEEDEYTENKDGSGSGLYKYTEWNTRPECSGAAYYQVTWAPATALVARDTTITIMHNDEFFIELGGLVSGGGNIPWAAQAGNKGPDHGQVSSEYYNLFRYTPTSTGALRDAFTFKVGNGSYESDEATITIIVDPTNEPPQVTGPVTATLSEFDAISNIDLLTGASDPDGDPLDAVSISLVGGDVSGVTIDAANNLLIVDPSAFSALNAGDSTVIICNYLIIDGRGGDESQFAFITINGG